MRLVRAVRFVAVMVVAGGLMLVGAPARTSAQQSPFTVVASGLDNPRGISVSSRGVVYVATAGKGGSDCVPSVDENGNPSTTCYGTTSKLLTIKNGTVATLVDNLPSIADAAGMSATGLVDVSVLGSDRIYGVIGYGIDPPLRDALGADTVARFGHTFRVTNSKGKLKINSNPPQYEADNNPDGGEIDSNPYGLLSVDNKRIVADAGANDLIEIQAADQIKTLAVFPDRLVDAPPFLGLPPGTQIPMQAVPNSVAKGPDGNYYVGQLTGFPFPVGGARVYKVDKHGGTPQVFAEGFTNIIDITFDKRGNLYVLELAKNGLLQAEAPGGDPTSQLTKIAPDGTRTVLANAGLVFASGVAVAPDGAIYVTNFGIFPGQGQVVKINQ